MLERTQGGIWKIRMMRSIKRWGLEEGQIVEVPTQLHDSHALRLLSDGGAERVAEVNTKAPTGKRQTRKTKAASSS